MLAVPVRTLPTLAAVTLAALACGALACGNAPPADAGADPPLSSLGPVATLQEELRIDGYEADLVPIGGLAVSADGRLAVSQPQDHQVRVFSPEGALLATHGRRGEGPGEFQHPGVPAWRGDTLVVVDNQLHRFTFFPPEGGEPWTRPGLRPLSLSDEFAFATEQWPRPDGTVLAEMRLGGASEVRAVVARPDGSEMRTLLSAAVEMHDIAVGMDGGRAVTSSPFPNEPRTALSDDGNRAVVAQAALDGDDAGTFLLTAVAAGGDTLFSRRYAFHPVEVTPAFADSVIDRRAASIEPSSPALAAAFRREARLPPMLPPVLTLRYGVDGTLWLRLRTPSDERLYTVLDDEGLPVGQVRPPPRGGPRLMSRTHVWAVEHDDVGMPSIVRYRVLWP